MPHFSHPRNLPLALTLLILGVYLLTMSGHTYSPDEETMLAVAQSLAVDGSWALSPSRALVEVTGADGRQYSQYGPGQSLAALPWVIVGRFVGGFFPKDQAGFPLRLILASYNALIAAGVCGLFAAIGLALGYGRRAVIVATLGLAFCTYLWPHSRTFFSEPLVGLCLLASFYLLLRSSHSRSWLGVLSGALFAAAVMVKVQYAVALPAYLVYMLIMFKRSNVQTFKRYNSLLWLTGLMFGLLPLFLYNLLVFGGPFTTGYGADLKGNFRTPLYEGVFGLLLSPGKGLLWYALPLALALWGASRFASKHGAVAAFIVTLTLLLVGFFGLYVLWPGDGSWGPRYLIPLLPFVLLPAVGTLERWNVGTLERVTVGVVLVVGLLINLLGVLVNFDTYINVVDDETARYWNPQASPIVGHANLLGQRADEWTTRLFPGPGDILLKSGFSYSEGDKPSGETLPRWTTGEGVIEVHNRGAASVAPTMTLRLTDHRPPELPRANVAILVDGKNLNATIAPVEGKPASSDYTITLPEQANPTLVTLQTDTWNPSELEKGGRDEALGVFLERISVTENVGEKPYKIAESLPAPPYYPQPRWYYNPSAHHPADLWPVYMAETGMGRKAMLVLGLPIIALGAAFFILGLLGIINPKQSKITS